MNHQADPSYKRMPVRAWQWLIGVVAMASLAAGAGTVRERAPVGPAEVVVLALADLGLGDAVDSADASGAVSTVLVRDGTLRFMTPGDTGAPQRAEFALTKGGVRTTLIQPIRTLRPVAPSAYEEGSSERTPPPRLSIAGFGPGNTFTGMPLGFTLDTRAALDLARDSDGLIRAPDGARVSLKPYWRFEPHGNRFTIEGDRLARLMAALPGGALDVSLNFVSADGEFAVAYDLLALRPTATLDGRLVTPHGAAATGLAGRKILLHGRDQRLRRVADVDAAGRFTFADIVPDTYQLTLADLAHPNLASAHVGVGRHAATVQATIVVPDTPR